MYKINVIIPKKQVALIIILSGICLQLISISSLFHPDLFYKIFLYSGTLIGLFGTLLTLKLFAIPKSDATKIEVD